MPYFKGFAGVSTIKAKKSFIFSSLFLGNLITPCDCLPVARRNANNNRRYKMKTKLNLPRELEIPTADLWLSTGAITITETGDENTYYVNEFGHLFFCKNYPSNESAMGRGEA